MGVGPDTAPGTGFDWLVLSETSSIHTDFLGKRNINDFRQTPNLRRDFDSDSSVKMPPKKAQASVKTYAIPLSSPKNTQVHAIQP